MSEDGLFKGINASASAMSAKKLRMTVASENLAHAGSTKRLENGLPYARQRVLFGSVLNEKGQPTGQVQADVEVSPRYIERHDPQHPDADPETGIVVEADIDPILELTDLMVANKAYESNANAVRGLLQMYDQALRLGEGL